MRTNKIILSTILLCMGVTVSAIKRSDLASYASSLNGKKKSELKTAVFNLIKSPKTLTYGSGSKCTWWGFYYTDRDDDTNECINRYSDRKFYFSSTNTGSAIKEMNIEHSFPKSWWGGTGNDAARDLYNLYPSDSKANSSKSNYPMCKVEVIDKDKSSDKYDKVGHSTINGKYVWCWEPGDQYKGDFARSYMYMATCYQDLTWQGEQGLQQLENNTWPTLQEWAYTLYLDWLKDDPVDQLEVERNNAVADLQKTTDSNGNITKRSRNLFIDYPYLAEYIWGDSIDVAFNPATSITTADDDLRYNGEPLVAVAKPQISPDGGTFDEPQTVTITTGTAGAVIKYTLDGSSPVDGGTVYSGPITISNTTTLKAVAIDGMGKTSTVASATFTIVIDSGDVPINDYFAETFDNCSGTGGNDGIFNSGASATFKPNYDGWQAVAAYAGDGCARFGSSSKSGAVSTPMLNLSGSTTFSFRAAPFGSDGTALKLSVNGDAELSETELEMTAGQWKEFSVTIAGEGPVIITFTPAKRFFLDDVRLQNGLAPTPTPTDVFGDLNGDGEVNMLDVTILINIILERE